MTTSTTRPRAGRVAQVVGTDYLLANFGYYMVLPVLPVLLADRQDGRPGWWIGVELFVLAAGVRAGSLPFTHLISRFQVRQAVVGGLLMAAGGLALVEISPHPAFTVLALALAGLGVSINALASRTYIAIGAGSAGERNSLFSLIQIAVNIAAAVGPIIANFLLGNRFRSHLILVPVAVYLIAAMVVGPLIPAGTRLVEGNLRPPTRLHRLVASMVSPALRSITLAAVAGSLLYGQFFSAFALLINLITGDSLVRAGLFTMNAILVIVVQIPVTRRVNRHLEAGGAPVSVLVLGVACFGLAFGVVALTGEHVLTVYLAIAVFSFAETLFTPMVNTAFVEAADGRSMVEMLNMRQVTWAVGESAGALIAGSVFLTAWHSDSLSIYWWSLVITALVTVVLCIRFQRRNRGISAQ